MLKRLLIRNIALIDEIEIEWGKDFNVLTGETGAGKSITVEALLLILGERASPDLIREGQTRGMVEATFELGKTNEIHLLLSEQGIELEDHEFVLRREISSDGKSRAFVNGSQVTVSFLKKLGESLIDLHGQHEHQSLLNTQYQRDFLDIFSDLLPLRASLKECYFQLQNALNKKKALGESLADRERQLEFLRYQEKEISELNIEEEEEKKLEEELNVLSHSEKIRELFHRIEGILNETRPSLLDQLSSFSQDLEELSKIDETLAKEFSDVKEIQYRLEDVQNLLREKFGRFDFDPERLRWIEERLLEIKRLKKKYGGQIFHVLFDVRLKISELEKGEESLDQVNREIEKYQALYDQRAQKLSKQRKVESQKLSRGLIKDLEELGIKGVIFEVRVEEGPIGPTGRDLISFYISTNVGQSPKPLHEIVSGGELSRIMLSLKTLLSEKDFVPILVFDEIDVNLGGQAAHKVAQKLKEISKNHQIIVVTHLAQIAAYADHHYCVEKLESMKKIKMCVRYMASEDRPKEIARMLGGNYDSKVALSHAQELLNVGQK